MTFSIPDDLQKKLKTRLDMNWPEIFKEGLRKKLEILEHLRAQGEL